jgi:8-oxo-dGTP pyrophosphatase MutT (NUDIX family)
MGRRPPPFAGEPVAPRPAATVVLLRPGPKGQEVLLTRRPSTMAFAAGMMVFPGGRVDPADADPRLMARSALGPVEAADRLGGATDPALAAALHVAAVRELFEEAGVLLADGPDSSVPTEALRLELLTGRLTFADVAERLDLRLRPDRLVPIARWVTPAAYPRRFDARFFAAELPPGAEATFVGDEVADHRWTTPRAALDAMAAREIEMWIPTSSTLQRLVELSTFADVAERLTVGPTRPSRVQRLSADVVRSSSWTAGGVPGVTVQTLVIGHDELVVVDPGDPSPEAVASVLAIARAAAGKIVAIAISSADPARAAGADELSERTGAPVYGPPGSAAWLPFPVVELARPPEDPRAYPRWIGLGEEPGDTDRLAR